MPEKLPALALAPRGYKSGAKLRLSRQKDTDTNTHARIHTLTHIYKQTHTLRYRYITHTPHAAHKSKSNCELVAIKQQQKQQQQSQSEAAARQSSFLLSLLPSLSLPPLSVGSAFDYLLGRVFHCPAVHLALLLDNFFSGLLYAPYAFKAHTIMANDACERAVSSRVPASLPLSPSLSFSLYPSQRPMCVRECDCISAALPRYLPLCVSTLRQQCA